MAMENERLQSQALESLENKAAAAIFPLPVKHSRTFVKLRIYCCLVACEEAEDWKVTVVSVVGLVPLPFPISHPAPQNALPLPFCVRQERKDAVGELHKKAVLAVPWSLFALYVLTVQGLGNQRVCVCSA